MNKYKNGYIKSDFKFSLFKGENDLKEFIDKISKQKSDELNDKLCVVSIIGKSDFNSNSCKAELIDEAIRKNVFKENFFQDNFVDDQILNEIEGFYDAKNKVIFLHLISPMDTDQMTKILSKLDRKLKERGFLDIWPELNLNLMKAILILFLVSHIVVVVTPSFQIDINFLQVFRLIDQLRTRTQSLISNLLKEIPELNKNWIHSGRPCSPRVLFVFEYYYDENIIEHINQNKRKYELYLEDQLYRFLRKSRIITNVCSSALFAVCNQNDFVYLSTKQSSIRDSNEFFNELLLHYCNKKNDSILLSTNCNELLSLDNNQMKEKERSFFDFLWTHINTALTKGFDDNVGRHNATPIFELPKLVTFSRVLICLKDFFFKQLVNENQDLKSISNKLSLSLNTDNLFSEARCTKILPLAFSFYREKLLANYTQEIHEQKLNQTLQYFASQVRGSSARKYAKILEQDCEKYFKNGHQCCGIMSLFNNHCMNPIHRTKSSSDNLDDNLKIMDHCSNVKYISACNCGSRQANRDDPFTIRQANHDFFYNLSMKCNCNELVSFEFPLFEGSFETAKPALLNRLMSLNLEDEEDESCYSDDYEDETDEENANQDCFADKLQTQEESQPLDLSQANLKSSLIDNVLDQNLISSEDDEQKENKVEKKKLSNDKSTAQSNQDQESSDDNSQIVNVKKESNKKEDNLKKSIEFVKTEYSKTEYLNGMLNSRSPKNILPIFNSWSLVCLGNSSIYSHDIGIQNQPGFITNTNYLLPWDVIVKIEHSGDLPKVWHGKKPAGIKNKKVLQDGTQFTVKLFIGIEYECLKGHRFICSKPNTILKAQFGQIKETANQLVSSDMPLFMPCVCSSSKESEKLAQLMRVHVVTPKAPILITLNPRIQISVAPCPVFYPMNINENNPEEIIKLTQSAYWVLRLPFVYQQMINSPITKIYTPSTNVGLFLKDAFGICKFISTGNEDMPGHRKNTGFF